MTPTRDDLLIAADWLDCYDGDGTDDNNDKMRRVADWLQAQAREMYRRDLIAQVAAKNGLRKNSAKVRAAVDKHLAEKGL